ncbi:MAG: prenyltransferase [Thermoguttaceae bacterium]
MSLAPYFLSTRPWSLTFSVVAVLIGTLVSGVPITQIAWGWLLLTVIGVVAFHTGGNVINDYFDTVSGVDNATLPPERLKYHAVLSGLLSLRFVFWEGMAFLAVAAVIGVTLTYFRSIQIVWIGAVAMVATYFYSGGGLRFGYKYRGAASELIFFLLWGPLLVEGACLVQSQQLSLGALLVSPLIGVWVALVLFANNIRDIETDTAANIKTLAIILGRAGSLKLFRGLVCGAFVYAALLAAMSFVTPFGTPWLGLTWLTIVPAWRLLGRLERSPYPPDADSQTAQVSTLFGLLVVVALVLKAGV